LETERAIKTLNQEYIFFKGEGLDKVCANFDDEISNTLK
jgi:hypothetical protein